MNFLIFLLSAGHWNGGQGTDARTGGRETHGTGGRERTSLNASNESGRI